ncbi:MAG: hypothetical protein AAFP17_16495 [Pseudomonadota bacterium]
MKVLEESHDRLVLGFTPWGPWIVSCVAGVGFVAFALFAPIEMPPWARLVFGGLGVVAPIAFLASHAAVQIDFSRDAGMAKITRNRPIGGVSNEIIPLDRILEVEEVVTTDADDDTHRRIELIVADRAGHVERVALTTGPIATDQAKTAERLARWLGVPNRSRAR